MKARFLTLVLVFTCFTVASAHARYMNQLRHYDYVSSSPPAVTTTTYHANSARYVHTAPQSTFQPVAQIKSRPPQLRQYDDGGGLQVYAKGDPVNNTDPWGLECGVVVKRFVSKGTGPSSWIDMGHEWLSTGSGSIGFWPNGAGIPGREWSVFSPDRAESYPKAPDIIWDTKRDKGWFNEKKLKWGSGKGKKCCTATCSDITSCVLSSPDPGWRDMPIFNNCRKYVGVTLKGCCLSKGKRR